MKIEYIHSSEPEKIKIYDTVKAFHKRTVLYRDTQKEFDEQELRNLERDKQTGLILSYKVIG